MKKTSKDNLRRRRIDMDAEMITRFENGVKNLMELKDQFSEIAKGAHLAFDHEIILNGPQKNDGLVCDVAQLKDTVNGNEEKKIVGLGSQIRALSNKLGYYWNVGRGYVLAMSFLVLVLVASHMVEIGTALQAIHP